MNHELKEKILKKLEVFKTDKFTFDEKSHTYLLNKKKFVSVTTFIKKFSVAFNTEEQSKKSAIKLLTKEGKDLSDINIKIYQNRLIKEWDSKRDIGCELGSITHKSIEELLNGEPLTPILNDEALKRFLLFKNKIYDKKMKNNVIPLGQEIRVFSEELGLAGTIDCLVLRLGKDNKWRLEIWDWKTNKKMTTNSDKCYRKLLQPFNDEWENELNKYSIQLNLYKLILASKNIFVDGECVIVYIPPNNEEPIVLKCQNYIEKLEMYFGVNYYTKLKKLFL